MGMIDGLFRMLFGDGRNAVVETVELFRPGAEKQAMREADALQAALGQFAAEFQGPRRSLFDRVIDGLNRLPRPALALGTLALFGAAMANPEWFSGRMQGLALVPEPLWWLMGAIISFYFGARSQVKGQEFQQSLVQALASAPRPAPATIPPEALSAPDANPALQDWRAGQ